jgi:hypothetical protein
LRKFCGIFRHSVRLYLNIEFFNRCERVGRWSSLFAFSIYGFRGLIMGESSGKTSKITATLLAAACVGLMSSQAKAGSIYFDTTTDTSGDPTHPTLLPAGTTEIDGGLGTLLGGGVLDLTDAFVVPLPHTGSPTSVEIDYSFPDGVGVHQTISDSTGGTSSFVNIPFGGSTSGSLTLSIPANLDLKVVETFASEDSVIAYTLDVKYATTVPLPKSAGLGAAGLATLGALALLGKKAKPSI